MFVIPVSLPEQVLAKTNAYRAACCYERESSRGASSLSEVWRFNPRASAIVQNAMGEVLLCRKDGLPFWMLPGGKIELGEKAVEAVRREVAEELGAKVVSAEPIWIVEHLFVLGGTGFHEYGLYFLTKVCPEPPTREAIKGRELGLDFRWFKICDLTGVDVRPSLLRTELTRLNSGFRFIES